MTHSDYERENLLDIMYLIEKQKQIEQEYWQWEHRKPAIIEVVIDKKEEYEKLPDAGKLFYLEREKREKKQGYTLSSGLGIYDVENKANIGKDKKYFIDKINKFMAQK